MGDDDGALPREQVGSAADDLAAYLAEPDWPEDDDDITADMVPVPEDAAQATRLLRKLGRLDADEADVAKVAQAERTRIDRWEADRLSGIGRAREWVARSLEAWMRHVHDTTGKVTIKLPTGEAKLRPGRPRVVVHDEAAACAQHPEWVKPPAAPTFARGEAQLKEGPRCDPKDYPEGVAAPDLGREYRYAIDPNGEKVAGVLIDVATRRIFSFTTKEQNR